MQIQGKEMGTLEREMNTISTGSRLAVENYGAMIKGSL